MVRHQDVDVLQWLVTEPSLMIAEIVDSHFMPLLWTERSDLVFAVGCGIARYVCVCVCVFVCVRERNQKIDSFSCRRVRSVAIFVVDLRTVF
jgi:hypothetical protein